MSNRHPAGEFVKLFPSDEIPRIIQDIMLACQSLQRERSAELENQLSYRLYKKIIFTPEYRLGPLTVVPLWECPVVNYTEDESEIRGRADILFQYPGGGLETYFLVEAKRLFVASRNGRIDKLTGKYIDEGMMRFVTGQYASRMVSGAMLGYIFDKPIEDAETSLAAAIKVKREKLKIAKHGNWQESSLSVIPPVNETRHECSQGIFTLFHILTKV
jgi:hypothetical protein